MCARRIRADRILRDGVVSGADLRAMREMFGITVDTARRYDAMAADLDEAARVPALN